MIPGIGSASGPWIDNKKVWKNMKGNSTYFFRYRKRRGKTRLLSIRKSDRQFNFDQFSEHLMLNFFL